MARLFTSGFEIDASSSTGNEWASSAGTLSVQTTVARSGNRALRMTGLASTASYFSGQFLPAFTSGTYFTRFYLRVDTAPSATNTIASFNSGSGAPTSNRSMVKLNANATLELWTNDAQVGSDSPALDLGVWYRIEMWYDDSASSGSKVLRGYIDGVEWAGSSTLTSVGFGSSHFLVGGCLRSESTSSSDWYIDDVCVNDDTGSQQNSLPGAGGVINLFPDSAGDVNTWQKSNGSAGTSTNYQSVDENPPDDGSSLVRANTAGAQDLYNLESSGLDSDATINCVQVWARHRNNTADATTAYALTIRKTSGGTEAQGTTLTPNSTTWRTGSGGGSVLATPSLTAHLDPDGAAWTTATVDSMQVGPKLITTGTNYVQVSTVWAVVDYAPASAVDDTASPAVLASTVTLPAPTVSVSATASPAAVATAAALPAATLSAGAAAAPAAVVSAAALPAATVSATGVPLATLVDNFDDDSIDTGRWPGNYGGVAETGGRFVIDCDSGQWSGLKSAASYTLDGTFVLLRAYPPEPNTATVAYLSTLVTTTTPGTDAGFNIDSASGGIAFLDRTGFSDPGAVFDTYSPTDHAWLRLREAAGTLYWETSPDGQAWTVRRSDTTPTWAADGDLALVVESHRDAGTDNTAAVDNVNTVSATASPGAVATAAGLPAAQAGGGATVTATVVASTSTLPAGTVTAGSSATPAAVSSSATLPAAAVAAAASVNPSPLATSATLPAAALSAGSTVSPAAVASQTAMSAPAVNAGSTAMPDPLATVAALPTPQVTATGSGTASPETVATTAGLPQAAASAGSRTSPATLTSTAALPSVAPSAGAVKTPPAVATTTALPAAAATAGATATPAPLALVASIPALAATGGTGGTAAPQPVATLATFPAAVVVGGSAAYPATVATVSTIPAVQASTPGALIHQPAEGTITRPSSGTIARPSTGLILHP